MKHRAKQPVAAYVGFDAVSTAAEETLNPQRDVPIGLIGSLLICTLFFLLAAGGTIIPRHTFMRSTIL
jgi:amino acid transporter